MAYRKFLGWLVTLIVSSTLAAGCINNQDTETPPDEFILNSIRFGDPCAPPCWHGLNVDVSTKAEVMFTIQNLEFVDQETIFEYFQDWANYKNVDSISFFCKFPTGGVCADFTFSKGVLNSISISVDETISLKVIIESIGKPNFVTAEPYGHHGGCDLSLYWENFRIIVFMLRENNLLCEQIKIGEPLEENVTVTGIAYITEEEMKTWAMRFETLPWPGLKP